MNIIDFLKSKKDRKFFFDIDKNDMIDWLIKEAEVDLQKESHFDINIWEKACREWLKGCSCASESKPEGCTECTAAFLNHLKHLVAGNCKD